MLTRILLAGLFASTLAFAQRGGGGGGGRGGSHMPGMGFTGQRPDGMFDALKFSKDQKRDVKAAMDDAQKEAGPIHDQMLKGHLAIAEAVAAGKSQEEVDKRRGFCWRDFWPRRWRLPSAAEAAVVGAAARTCPGWALQAHASTVCPMRSNSVRTRRETSRRPWTMRRRKLPPSMTRCSRATWQSPRPSPRARARKKSIRRSTARRNWKRRWPPSNCMPSPRPSLSWGLTRSSAAYK